MGTEIRSRRNVKRGGDDDGSTRNAVGCTPAPPTAAAGVNATEACAETILLIEDDEAVRTIGSRTLERSGYTVLSAHDGADALRIAATHPGSIDLVVTDVVMPGMRGPELAVRLRAQRPNLRVLFVSGYFEVPRSGAEIGQAEDEFLAKPFAPAELVRRVRTILDQGSRCPAARG